MKKYNKLIFVASVLFSVTAVSAPFTENQASDLLKDLLIGNKSQVERKVNRHNEYEVFAAVQYLSGLYLTEEEDVSLSAFANDMLMIKQEGFVEDYFKSSYAGMTVYKKDSLFDMERLRFENPEFEIKKKSNMLNSYNPIFEEEIPQTTLHRMSMGLPGIGPDNKNILVCRFFSLEGASYFEISTSDAERMLNYTQSKSTIDEACLISNEYTYPYWEKRLSEMNDFF